MRENLTVSGACDATPPLPGADGRSAGDANSPDLLSKTRLLGFDQTRAITMVTNTPKGAIGVYPPVTVLRVPEAIEKAEIRKLAVMATPTGFFLGKCWWALQIETGAPQEFSLLTELADNTGLTGAFPPVPTGQTIVSGIRYTAYGSLQEPQDLVVQLAADANVQLAVWSESGSGGVPLTVYVRVQGYVFNKGR